MISWRLVKNVCTLFALTILLSMCGRSQNTGSMIKVFPSTFKVTMPLRIDNRGIVVSTFWGTSRDVVDLLWDNNSPTWANESVIQNNKSISRMRDYAYSSTTADGTPIQGDVYTCDSVSLGQLSFKRVPFYKISSKMAGAFGENLISKGVWEINFVKKVLIFASGIDSLEDSKEARLLSNNFSDNIIKLDVSFRNKIVESLQLDLGFRGGILVPVDEFNNIAKGNKNIYKRMLQYSTPVSINNVETTNAYDTVRIKKYPFTTVVSTNELVREKVVGLGFFEQFDFFIIDYKKHSFYVSKTQRR